MPVNAGPEFMEAELEYQRATTPEERLLGLKKMLKTAPKHKGSEKLLAEIKKKIAKILEQQERVKQIAKRAGRASAGIKKEGAARVCIIGATNTGKSSLLAKITNSKARISEYPYTTTEPEIGVLDYIGIKVQVVEIPAIIQDFIETDSGSYFVSLMKESSLLIVLYRNEEERKLVRSELRKMRLSVPTIELSQQEAKERSQDVPWKIWKNLGLIKVYTKQPRKPKEFPPVSLGKGATIRDLATKIHKDFVQKFKHARVFGSSVKFPGQQVGLGHVLTDDDVVELYTKD